MSGMMRMTKELYNQPYWKNMQDVLFDSFDIASFDGDVLEIKCTGKGVPDGWFWCEATDLAKVDGKTDILVEFHQDGKEPTTVIIKI